MTSFFFWLIVFALFLAGPIISIIVFFRCLGSYLSALPFTEEKEKKKRNLISASIVAIILVGSFLGIVFYYGFTNFLTF